MNPLEYLEWIVSTPVQRRGEVVPPVVCGDGTELSVQASRKHCCVPKDDDGPWSAVEVGYVTEGVRVPRSWGYYCGVADFVSVRKVRAFVKRHGG